MAPSIASAKLTLSYPIYASDFDPQNSDFLLVGGGGGEGRTGVGNKIVRNIVPMTAWLSTDPALDPHRHLSKTDHLSGRGRRSFQR